MNGHFYFNQDLFDPLITALEEETRIYHQLVTVIRKKQRQIIKSDLNALRACVAEEQQLLQQAKSAEKHRKHLVNTIALTKELSTDSPSLVDLILVAPEPYSTQLKHLRKQIHGELNAMVTVNRENDLLLNTSLNHVRGMVQLFLSVNDDAPSTYTPQGTVDTRDISNQVVDCRI